MEVDSSYEWVQYISRCCIKKVKPLFYRHVSFAPVRCKETFLQGSIEKVCHKECNNLIPYVTYIYI